MSSTTDPHNQTSAEIERQVEGTRAGLAHSLDVLRERVSPDHLMDQAVQYVRTAGGDDFTRNLTAAVRENPLPVLLIGAGIGWMLMSGQKNADRDATSSTVVRRIPGSVPAGTAPGAAPASSGAKASGMAGNMVSGIGSSAGSAASTARDWASQTATTAQQSASDAVGRAGEMAGSAYEAVSSAAGSAAGQLGEGASVVGGHIADLAHSAQEQVARAGSSVGSSVGTSSQGLQKILHDQPLALAALGIAVGAAVGALIPVTQAENRLLGTTSDALQEKVKAAAQDGLAQVQHVAGEHLDKVKSAVADSIDHAQGHIQEGGLSPQTLGETLGTAAHELRQVVQDTAHQAAGQVRDAVGDGHSADAEPKSPA